MPAPPEWLERMANAVARLIEPMDFLSPLGCHFHKEGGIWEVTLFASATELVGGAKDGVHRVSNFTVDVLELAHVLTEVHEMRWQSLPHGNRDDLGAHLSIEGIYEGNLVWVRVLARPPKQFAPGRQAHFYETAWKEVW